jgi:hypothetical protein
MQHPELRQMCAKVRPSQSDAALDQVTNLLDLSKRAFIEAAAVSGPFQGAIRRSATPWIKTR